MLARRLRAAPCGEGDRRLVYCAWPEVERTRQRARCLERWPRVARRAFGAFSRLGLNLKLLAMRPNEAMKLTKGGPR